MIANHRPRATRRAALKALGVSVALVAVYSIVVVLQHLSVTDVGHGSRMTAVRTEGLRMPLADGAVATPGNTLAASGGSNGAPAINLMFDSASDKDGGADSAGVADASTIAGTAAQAAATSLQASADALVPTSTSTRKPTEAGGWPDIFNLNPAADGGDAGGAAKAPGAAPVTGAGAVAANAPQPLHPSPSPSASQPRAKPSTGARMGKSSGTKLDPFKSEVDAGMDRVAWPMLDQLWQALTTGRIDSVQSGAGLFGPLDDGAPGSSSAILGPSYGYESVEVDEADQAGFTTEKQLLDGFENDEVAMGMWTNIKDALALSPCPSAVARRAAAQHATDPDGEPEPDELEMYTPAELLVREDDRLTMRLLGEHISVLVVGSGEGHLSLRVAAGLDDASVVSVAWPADVAEAAVLASSTGTVSTSPADRVVDARKAASLRNVVGADNNVVCETPITQSLVRRLQAQGTRFSIIVVQDLPGLVGSMLPHELEEVIGGLLSLSRYTVLPKELPNNRFFSYWDNTASLAYAGATAANLRLRARPVEHTKEGAVLVLESLPLADAELRSSALRVARADAQDTADMIRRKVDERNAEAEFGNEDAGNRVGEWSDEAIRRHVIERRADNDYATSSDDDIQAVRMSGCGDASHCAASGGSGGVLLSTLLALGIVPEDRQALFTTFLRSRLARDAAADAIYFDAGRLVHHVDTIDVIDAPLGGGGGGGVGGDAAAPAADATDDGPTVFGAPLAVDGVPPPLPPAADPTAFGGAVPDATAGVSAPDDGSDDDAGAPTADAFGMDNWQGGGDFSGPPDSDAGPAGDGVDADAKAGDLASFFAKAADAAAADAATVADADTGAAPAADAADATPKLRGSVSGADAADGGAALGRRLLNLHVDEPAHKAAALSTLAAEHPAAAASIARAQRSRSHQTRVEDWAGVEGDDQSRLVMSETDAFSAWWSVLQRELAGPGASGVGAKRAGKDWSAAVYGRSYGLLAAKIARAFPSTTVVSVKPDRHEVSPHLALLDLLNVRNNLVCRTRLTAARVEDVLAGGDQFRYQVLGIDVFEELLASATSLDDFERLLGRVLSMSATTLLEIPSWSALDHALRVLGPTADAPAPGSVSFEHDRDAPFDLSELDPEVFGDYMFADDDVSSDSDSVYTLNSFDAASAASAMAGAAALGDSGDGSGGDGSNGGGRGRAGGAAARGNVAAEATAASVSARYDSSGAALTGAAVAGSASSPPGRGGKSADDVPFVALLQAAARKADFSDVSARFLSPAEGASPPAADFAFGPVPRPDWDSEAGDDASSSESSLGKRWVPTTRFVRVDMYEWARYHGNDKILSTPGVSLHTLLALGLVDKMRAEVFRMFLELPLPDLGPNLEYLKPWNIRYEHSPLHLTSAAAAADPSAAAAHSEASKRVLVLGGRLQYSAKVGRAGNRQFSSDDRRTEFARIGGVISEPSAKDAALGVVGGPYLGPSPDVVDPRWAILAAELTPEDTSCGGGAGKFSIVEYNSGAGVLSLNIANKFRDATVLSIEPSRRLTDAHYAAVLRGNNSNVIICRTGVDVELAHDLAVSPEFFRYQVLSGDLVDLIVSQGLDDVQSMVGSMLGLSLTTFLQLPSAKALSLAFTTFFHTYADPDVVRGGTGLAPRKAEPVSQAALAPRYKIEHHPRAAFAGAETRVLSDLARGHGETQVKVTPLGNTARGSVHNHWSEGGGGDGGGDTEGHAGGRLDEAVHAAEWRGINMVRVDLREVRREVNHHFQSWIDGHDRKYTFRVAINDTATAEYRRAHDATKGALFASPDAVSKAVALPIGNHPNNLEVATVGLVRAMDGAPIPYDTIYSSTLITVMRLGLLAPQQASAYHNFVAMPLYLDMAPWNIVFQGRNLNYIDYDTKDRTYDSYVPMLYQLMEVMFNYERTVKDFGHCGPKGSNPYGFGFVSSCVGSANQPKCKSSVLPVPCPDQTCKPDYVTCLRSMSRADLEDFRQTDRLQGLQDALRTMSKALAENDIPAQDSAEKLWQELKGAEIVAELHAKKAFADGARGAPGAGGGGGKGAATGAVPPMSAKEALNLRGQSFIADGTFSFGRDGRVADDDSGILDPGGYL